MRGTRRGLSLGSPFAVTRLARGSGDLPGRLPFAISGVVRTRPCLEPLQGCSTSLIGGRFSLAEIWILETTHVELQDPSHWNGAYASCTSSQMSGERHSRDLSSSRSKMNSFVSRP